MKRILDLVVAQQERFAVKPFFGQMERQEPYAVVCPVVPQLAFWVLTFHDLLALCEERMEDSALRKIISHHRAEESGHDVWYLDDLVRLGVPLPGSVALFGRQHETVRRASYALMAEAIRSESDWVRIALVLMMEATGAVFFTRSAEYRHWPVDGLSFFSGKHLEVEKAHELFEQRMHTFLRAQTLSDGEHATAAAAVLRGFAAFDDMFAELDAHRPVVVPERLSIPA